MGEDVIIDFHSNDYAAIPGDILFDVMKQYRGCGCFYVELVFSGEENKIITSEVILTSNLMSKLYIKIQHSIAFSNYRII